MTFCKKIVSGILKTAGVVLASSLIATQAFAGWSVSGTQVIDPNGSNFIFRGINFPYAWFTSKTTQGLKDIAATGANSARIVLQNGSQGGTRSSGSDVSNIISQCKANKLVCILEVHEATGWGDNANATTISQAADYWVSSDIKSAIVGQENYVIVNIANEPFGGSVSASTFVNDTSNAIKKLRNAGLTHLIMIDGPGWGQDPSYYMRDNAPTLYNADTLHRLVFSVHMYEVYNNASRIQQYLSSFQSKGYALVIGEFGTENNGANVDEASIMQYARDYGIGYLGWSWSGNGSCCTKLDIVNNFVAGSYTTWGDFLMNSSNGIKATSKLASNFGGNSSGGTTTIDQCNWYGTKYPICNNSNNGWGWENNTSCVARSSCTALPSPYGVVKAPTQCNWYGKTYALCKNTSSGWGWENNQSCVAPADCSALKAPNGPY